jgi:hypothetical protein
MILTGMVWVLNQHQLDDNETLFIFLGIVQLLHSQNSVNKSLAHHLPNFAESSSSLFAQTSPWPVSRSSSPAIYLF